MDPDYAYALPIQDGALTVSIALQIAADPEVRAYLAQAAQTVTASTRSATEARAPSVQTRAPGKSSAAARQHKEVCS